ncbi:hypothetical protein EVAR_48021_1 [Eumeta japonica]|uniref:Uncharacterized protein n=1 Tax=Eumeta variegata TaxID=151549 RepID=A0A4C1XSX9_EUMVA|nr:hypothetical protein EVAR_48021_1 [Eumeta japonica]
MRTKECVKRRKNEIRDYDRRFSDDSWSNQKVCWHMVRKTRNNSRTSCIHVIRDDDGHLLNEENNMKERRKNYFESVFACEYTVADGNVTVIEYMIDRKFKKLPDMIVSSEMLMGGGGIEASLLCKLFKK